MKLHQVISAIALATLVASSPSPEPEPAPRRGRPPPQGCHSAFARSPDFIQDFQLLLCPGLLPLQRR
ncbi:hypothetical protein L249_3852 [Ophiocordyceps polyrhachis-furcata BCC 54312]|uniref:Uncharacterized protein n=1 Tax=Ophiocordyceps polyrhachis-furcata BCC 54312 TaxID=1330021 RepID=A0A367L612_9HYPO|nr:hypothetical protein L249_3852 [Ophiocordyceps polyrhachis-furcata BCC 54312]